MRGRALWWLVPLMLLAGGCGSQGGGAPCSKSAGPLVLRGGGVLAQGDIAFGTSLTADRRLHGRRTAFAPSDDMAWDAKFREPVPVSSTVQLVISRLDCSRMKQVHSGGEEADQYVQPVPGMGGNGTFRVAKVVGSRVVEFGEVINPMRRLAYGITDQGTYVMQYFRGSTKLAEGRFVIKG